MIYDYNLWSPEQVNCCQLFYDQIYDPCHPDEMRDELTYAPRKTAWQSLSMKVWISGFSKVLWSCRKMCFTKWSSMLWILKRILRRRNKCLWMTVVTKLWTLRSGMVWLLTQGFYVFGDHSKKSYQTKVFFAAKTVTLIKTYINK